MELTDLVTRLATALVFGAFIGLERQWRQRLAGLRTNALVAIGAASFTAFSMMQPAEVSPTRVAAQVVSGIGFLGAGVILREGINVRGLNTAATLWCSAAVGVFAGAGFVIPGAIVTALVTVANIVLRPAARLIGQRAGESAVENVVRYQLNFKARTATEMHVRALLLQSVAGSSLRLQRLSTEDTPIEGVVEVVAELMSLDRADIAVEATVRRLSLEPGVSSARWQAAADED